MKRVIVIAIAIAAIPAQAGEPFYKPKGSPCPPGSYSYGSNHCIQYQDTKRVERAMRYDSVYRELERLRKEREALQRRDY